MELDLGTLLLLIVSVALVVVLIIFLGGGMAMGGMAMMAGLMASPGGWVIIGLIAFGAYLLYIGGG